MNKLEVSVFNESTELIGGNFVSAGVCFDGIEKADVCFRSREAGVVGSKILFENGEREVRIVVHCGAREYAFESVDDLVEALEAACTVKNNKQ